MDRPIGISIEGPPDPETIVAELLPDLYPPIAGVVEPGTRHVLFDVPDDVQDSGAFVRAAAPGFVTQDRRLVDEAGDDIVIPTTATEILPPMVLEALAYPTAPAGRAGVPYTDKKAVGDDTGFWFPIGWTWMWALQSFRGDRPRHVETAAYMGLTQRLDYCRVLCEVGTGGNPNSSWAGNTIEPDAWPDYEEILAGVLDHARSIGKRVELCVLGKGTNTDPIKLCHRIADVVLDGRADLVQNIEMVNEYSAGLHVAIPTMVKMAKVFQARGVENTLALSSGGDGDEFKALDKAAREIGLTGFMVHPRRKSTDYGWSQVRQGYDNKDTRLKVNMDEPAGPGSSVEVQTDPLLLAMTRAVSILCGGAEYTYHTGTGVYGDGRSHASAGPRPANFQDIPNIDAQLAALRAIDEYLPVGVSNWSVRNTQRAGVPFDLPKSLHWGIGNEGSSGYGVNKAYSAVAGSGAFAQIPIGVKADAAHPCIMRAKFNMRDVAMILCRAAVEGPVTYDLVFEGQAFTTGQGLNLPGRVADAHVAYIITGQRA